MKDKLQHQLTGVSGVHFVAARLSWLGYHAVPTTRNVQGPDLLVSTINGSKSLAIQVKTTHWGGRDRGRGAAKAPHHLEWEIGWASARENNPGLFFALVDLRKWEGMPDVYFVPSRVIYENFAPWSKDSKPRCRYHPTVEVMAPYKNNWELIRQALEN